MGIETLLTGLEVNPHKGELLASFRGLGTISFPNWQHLFVSDILGSKRTAPEIVSQKIRAIYEQLESNPKLRPYLKKKTRIKDKYWQIYQLFCPVTLKGELPPEFLRGHYTQQARWRLTSPGNIVEISEDAVLALKTKIEIGELEEQLETEIGSQRARAYATRTLNDLEDLFESYDGTNYDLIRGRAGQIASLKRLDVDFFEKRKAIEDRTREVNSRLKDTTLIRRRVSKQDRRRELVVQQISPDYLKNARMISGDELWRKKWLFLDIEIPFFRREHPEISWVGMRYLHDGQITGSKIYVIGDPGVRGVEGYEIIVCKDESDLISKLSGDINKEDPDVCSSYNSRFDFIKLRETLAGFPIGEEESQPLFKVTTKFFERIGIRNRLLIDPLRWQKIARAYDINAKLEMAVGFEKSIDYDELEALEDQFRAEDKKAGLKEATYLAGDINGLTSLFFNPELRADLDLACQLSRMFGVGLERLLHSPNCINDSQERDYFKELGIYREDVPPHQKTKKQQQKRILARGRVREKIASEFPEEQQGLHQEVLKLAIPLGRFVSRVVLERFPKAQELYDLIKEQKDPRAVFFLEQYSKEFARWVLEDYGIYIQKRDDFDTELKRFKITESEFLAHYLQIEHSRLPPEDKERFAKAALGKRALQACLGRNNRDLIRKKGLSLDAFLGLINLRTSLERKSRNIAGNYAVLPDARAIGLGKYRAGKKMVVLEEELHQGIEEVRRFLGDEGLEVIATEGRYLYVKGKSEKLNQPDCPVILVDNIPRLYQADNPYYKKNGFYSHMKLKEEPDFHLSMFEMCAFRQMLDFLVLGNHSAALGVVKDALKKLDSGQVSFREMLFYNKSKERYSVLGGFNEAELDTTGKNGNKRTYFVLEQPEGAELQADENGRYFSDVVGKKEVRVYVSPEGLAVNKQLYRRKFEERARGILGPLLKEYRPRPKRREDPRQQQLF